MCNVMSDALCNAKCNIITFISNIFPSNKMVETLLSARRDSGMLLMESWLFCSLNTCKRKVTQFLSPTTHLQPLAHPQVSTQIVKQVLIQVQINN